VTDDTKGPPSSGPGTSIDETAITEVGNLVERLRSLCLAFETRHRIACVADLSREQLGIDPIVADVLVRTVEELLANVARHARASRVEITSVSRADGATLLLVKDDGIGFDLSSPSMLPRDGGGSGLLVADEQLREIGAYLEIASESGACVTIVLPGRAVIVD
jgi:signal transduction histidine kinase